MKPRVFFDSNAGSQAGGYMLWFHTSKAEIAAIKHVRTGLMVRLYTPDELEVDAVLQFSDEFGCWIGVPFGQYEMLDGSDS
jgi:hypothetical protein